MKHSLRKLAKRKLDRWDARYCCHDCGTVVDLTVHHVIPVALGGTSDIDNLVTLCRRCHDTRHGLLGGTA